MSGTTVTTITKMLEALPQDVQDRVAEHLREYILDLQDESRWDEQFGNSQGELAARARGARQEAKKGRARPLDPEDL